MGENKIQNKLENISRFLENKYSNSEINDKLEYFMNEIDKIIEPKEENITYQDINDFRDIFCEIKEDKSLYSLAIKKYKTKMIALECLFLEELNIIDLCELINAGKIWDNQITIEVKYNINIDELIYLNYLYNIAVNSLLQNKEVKIKILKEKTKTKTK